LAERPSSHGARRPFRGKDAGSVDSSAIDATEDAASGGGVLWAAQGCFAKPS